MTGRRLMFWLGVVCVAAGWMVWQVFSTHVVRAQQSDSTATIKAEARLVLVHTVVTDKKGTYIHDLEQKNLKVWADDKEQNIKSFSSESESGPSAKPQRHYLILFFDNSSMSFDEQARARDAAGKFIDANAGPNRLMAIVEFGGTMKVAQNFTADAGRLKQVASGIKTS